MSHIEDTGEGQRPKARDVRHLLEPAPPATTAAALLGGGIAWAAGSRGVADACWAAGTVPAATARTSTCAEIVRLDQLHSLRLHFSQEEESHFSLAPSAVPPGTHGVNDPDGAQRQLRGPCEKVPRFLRADWGSSPRTHGPPPMEKTLMSLTVVNGLPAHVLFVHFVIVLVPLSALALVVCAAWPGGARRLGLMLPILALVTLASVPVATHAGEWLEEHVGSDPLVRKHAELGDGLLPWALGLFLISAVVWWTARRSAPAADGTTGTSWSPPVLLRGAVVVLSLAVAVGAVVDVYRIGDSGAKAAWHDNYSKTATQHDG